MLLLMVTATACQTTTDTASTKSDNVRLACASFTPHKWSKDDPEWRIIQEKSHNAIYKELCDVKD